MKKTKFMTMARRMANDLSISKEISSEIIRGYIGATGSIEFSRSDIEAIYAVFVEAACKINYCAAARFRGLSTGDWEYALAK